MSKNRVEYQEDVELSIERIPFLKKFLRGDYQPFFYICPFDIDKINKYLGYEHLTPESIMTSGSVNVLLAEAEKRGDI
jgi:hypothetical protein